MSAPASRAFDGVVFDLDGVITDSAGAHAVAWKALFDAYLQACASVAGESFEPFDATRDYLRHVDGRQRQDGIRAFLGSRGIELPLGTPSDSPEMETVWGLGNRKDRLYQSFLQAQGVQVFTASVSLVRELKSTGVRCGLATSSRNCSLVLALAGLTDLFEEQVDGNLSSDLGLSGKPAPDIFLECARRMGVCPTRCVVVEDSTTGVQAGRDGGFRLVIGVDRVGRGESLRESGADVVLQELDLGVADIDRFCHVAALSRAQKRRPAGCL